MKYLILAITLLFTLPLYSADSTNIAVTFAETKLGVLFYGQFTFLGDSSQSRFTKAINLEGLDVANGSIVFYGNGASGIEIDVHMHGSNENYPTIDDSLTLTQFAEETLQSDKDSLGRTTATLAVFASGELSDSARYLVIEGDGQIGNALTGTLNFRAYFPKDTELIRRGKNYKKLVSSPVLPTK